MTQLRDSPRRVREGHARHGGSDHTDAELPGEQIRARERQCVREEEEEVVARDRRDRSFPDQAGRREAKQSVGERQAVVQRPVDVRLEQVERLVRQRVPNPGDLPGLVERVTEIARDVPAQVQCHRPMHCGRQQAGDQCERHELPPGDCGRRPHAAGRRSSTVARHE
jgi:hypothetical protein